CSSPIQGRLPCCLTVRCLMHKFMIAVLTSLFVMGVCSVSFAGVFDDAVNATEKANTMAKDAKTTTDSAEQIADNAKQIGNETQNEAQAASNQESESMKNQAKESAKKNVNEKIDNFFK
ncbi:MAG: hypothetical protein O7F12_12285, partial [Nitrospirae bacterium]|nr:hypothetical protein [Nitrospirota bacterium]